MTNVQSRALEILLRKFPQPFAFAFAYGSGVFPQKRGPVYQKKMIDFIFTVDNPLAFHKENVQYNSNHYSMMKYTGAECIQHLQEGFGAKIYFNTLIEVDNVLIKYGVISTGHLIEDLLDWQTLYVSGRLHKPVEIIKPAQTAELTRALHTNLQSALHASLLCLPETFSEEQLFLKIVSLSYNGDFRMYFGEDKKKIENIVQNQMDHFRILYAEHIKMMPLLYWKQSKGILEQDCTCETTLHHLNLLPKKVQHNILVRWSKDGRYRDMEDVLQSLAYEAECSEIVEKAIQDIVWWPSITQSLKGILTAVSFGRIFEVSNYWLLRSKTENYESRSDSTPPPPDTLSGARL